MRVLRKGRREDFRLPIQMPGSWINSALRTQAASRVAQDLTDHFVCTSTIWRRDPIEDLLQAAHIRLAQSRPDPAPTARCLKLCETGDNTPPVTKDLLKPNSAKLAWLVYWFIIRTAQTLHMHGEMSEARLVLDFGRNHYPAVCHSNRRPRLPPSARSAESEQREIRRKATPSEIQRGVSVDEDGCVLPNPHRQRVWEATRRL